MSLNLIVDAFRSVPHPKFGAGRAMCDSITQTIMQVSDSINVATQAMHACPLPIQYNTAWLLQATMAWESQDDGFIAKILLQEGAKDIPVNTPAMIFVEEEVRGCHIVQAANCVLQICHYRL